MKVKLAYGRSGMTVNMPDNRTTVIDPHFMPGIPDQGASILHALLHPIRSAALQDVVGPEDTVAIVFCDQSSPMPNALVLPIVLDQLQHVPRRNIVLVQATGARKSSGHDELSAAIAPAILKNYRVVQHNAHDRTTQTLVGRMTDGAEVWLNSEVVAASKRIVVGYIEPHFFAGFTGGPENIAPGVAGIDTIGALQSPRLIAQEKATWGIAAGNPVWERMCEAARLIDVAFNLSVTLNNRHHVTNVFAGELWQSHHIGVEFSRKTALRGIPQSFDVVVTTNAGYPLDQSLCQSVKGISAAAQIVRPGGAIVVAAECSEGIPETSNFKKLLKQAETADALLDMLNRPGAKAQDYWEAQILAQIQKKARVFLKAGYLSDQQIRDCLLLPISSVETCVSDLLEEMGPTATVGVLTQGPMAIPMVQAREPLAMV